MKCNGHLTFQCIIDCWGANFWQDTKIQSQEELTETLTVWKTLLHTSLTFSAQLIVEARV